MRVAIISNIFSIFSAVYVYWKIYAYRLKRIHIFLWLILSILFGCAEEFILIQWKIPSIISTFLCCCIICKLLFHYYGTFNLTVVAISVIFSAVASAFSFWLFVPAGAFYYSFITDTTLRDILAQLTVDVLRFLLCFLFFHLHRFRKGFPDITKTHSLSINLLICLLIFSISLILSLPQETPLYIDYLFIFIMTGVGVLLFVWWRKAIREKYMTKALENNIQILEEQMKAQSAELERLSTIIHKDNKQIKALSLAIESFISTPDSSKAPAIYEELISLLQEREQIFDDLDLRRAKLAKTNNIAIDSVIGYLLESSFLQDVDFDCTFIGDIPKMLEQIVSPAKLKPLILDFGENAIISTKTASQKAVFLTLGLQGEFYALNIFDSGEPFAPSVLYDFGRRRNTTHGDSGGSGIGLMTSYRFMKDVRASFELEELDDTLKYTKRISVVFDNRSQMRIKSKRPEVRSELKRRHEWIFMD